MQIVSPRFILRPLSVEDVTERYCGWLSDHMTGRFIVSKLNILELKQYVSERINREDVLFLGIFEKKSGLHIGNIKYEPINSGLGYAVMGILIGDAEWRGQGVAAEVLKVTAGWLHHKKNIRKIILGVNKLNTAAIRAYSKVGFVESSIKNVSNMQLENISMVWSLDSLNLDAN